MELSGRAQRQKSSRATKPACGRRIESDCLSNAVAALDARGRLTRLSAVARPNCERVVVTRLIPKRRSADIKQIPKSAPFGVDITTF